MSGIAVDTSVLVAGSVRQHEHHDVAAAPLRTSTVLVANCLTETWSVLSRGAFRFPVARVAEVVNGLLAAVPEVISVSAETVREVLDAGVSLGLGGNIHDAAIAVECRRREVSLVTLDRGQYRLALALDVDVRLLGA